MNKKIADLSWQELGYIVIGVDGMKEPLVYPKDVESRLNEAIREHKVDPKKPETEGLDYLIPNDVAKAIGLI